VCIRVEQFVNREAVGGLGRGELGVKAHPRRSSEPDQVDACERVVDLLH
jgi:hypothetical protein